MQIPEIDLSWLQVQLGRPGAAVANPTGDLAIVPFSQYSLKDRKYVSKHLLVLRIILIISTLSFER